jgi:ankyrin repeat protein
MLCGQSATACPPPSHHTHCLPQTASSALHEAAWGGHAAVVTEMLRLGVSHDLATPVRLSLLCPVGCLLVHAVHTHKHTNRAAPHHFSALQKSGYRALHMAAMTNSASVINVLLQSGAWVDARSQARIPCCSRFCVNAPMPYPYMPVAITTSRWSAHADGSHAPSPGM